MEPYRQYQHSGAVPLAGLGLTAGIGLAVVCVLGIIYSYLIVYIPFVYINFFITCGYGIVIGLSVGLAARAGKIRNPFVLGWLGFVFGLVGLYVAWGADLIARGGLEHGISAFQPTYLWRYVQWFYENGAWGLRAGGNVTGIFLGAVWVVEAVIIVGAATLLAPTLIASTPFCERCSQWTKTQEGLKKLLLQEGQQPVLERVLSGEIAALGELLRAPEDAGAYLRLDLASCDACAQSNYLTIQMVTHTVDKQGKPQTSTVGLLSNIELSQADVEAVRQAGP